MCLLLSHVLECIVCLVEFVDMTWIMLSHFHFSFILHGMKDNGLNYP